MPQDFLFYYLYQKAQVNTVAPSGTCTSYSAAMGVGHGEGQTTDSGMYNGFVRWGIYLYQFLKIFLLFFAVLKIFHINM